VKTTRQAARRRPAPFAALLVTSLSLMASVASAHKHAPHAAAESSAAVSSPMGSSAAAGAGIAPDSAGRPDGAPAAPRRYAMPGMWEALVEHPHNKLVHFPLALAVVAALLLVLGRRWPELDAAGRWLVWLAALGGVAAYVSGRLQEEAFDGEPKEWLVNLHEKWGLSTAIALVAWALLTLWKPTRKRAWLWGLVVAALVLITGFYGGIVAHGE